MEEVDEAPADARVDDRGDAFVRPPNGLGLANERATLGVRVSKISNIGELIILIYLVLNLNSAHFCVKVELQFLENNSYFMFLLTNKHIIPMIRR